VECAAVNAREGIRRGQVDDDVGRCDEAALCDLELWIPRREFDLCPVLAVWLIRASRAALRTHGGLAFPDY